MKPEKGPSVWPVLNWSSSASSLFWAEMLELLPTPLRARVSGDMAAMGMTSMALASGVRSAWATGLKVMTLPEAVATRVANIIAASRESLSSPMTMGTAPSLP